jgi:rsbT antagonist protein RsbS
MELRRLPIIRLWNRVVVPIQGEITDDLAEQISHEVLKAIHESGPRGLVLDLTGVWIMDSHLCSVLSNLAASARLMGTPTIISGLSPEIAMTLQMMGVELEGVATALSLEQALTMVGLDVREVDEDHLADGEDDDEIEEDLRAEVGPSGEAEVEESDPSGTRSRAGAESSRPAAPKGRM